MDQTRIGGLVGVALGPVAVDARLLRVRDDLHHPMGCHGMFIQQKCNDLPRLNVRRIHLSDVQQRPRRVRRFHRAGQHRIGLHPEQPSAYQRQRQQHHQDHYHGGQSIGDLPDHGVLSSLT